MDNKPGLRELQEIYSNLPKDLQQAIMSSKYQDTLVEIGRKYKLTIEQLGNLELHTTFVLMGVTHPNNFQHDLETELNVTDKAIIPKVVEEVNELVFKNIRTTLQAINEPAEGEPEDDDNETFWRQEKSNESILQKSGIEITSEKTGSKVADEEREEVSSSNRNELLRKIENPTIITPGSLASQKLQGSISVPRTETKYTAKNISTAPPTITPDSVKNIPSSPTPPPPPSPKNDPYRESI